MAESPILQELSLWQTSDLSVIMIALNDNKKSLREFMAHNSITYPVIDLGDSHSVLPMRYGVSSRWGNAAIPVDILIRPDKSIAYVQVGGADPRMISNRVEEIMRKH